MSDHLRELVLRGYVAGYDTPIALVRYGLNIEPESPIYQTMLAKVREIIDDRGFLAIAEKAMTDKVAFAMKSFRDDAVKYKLALDNIAFNSPIESNKLAALKDALNRAGTAPAQKQVFFSPADYAEEVEKNWLGPREPDADEGTDSEGA
jgi:hypothetical protein